MTIRGGFDELCARLAQRHMAVLQDLLPGLSRAELEGSFGAPVPTSIAEWFEACGGVRVRHGQTVSDVWVVPGYYPLTLIESMDLVHAWRTEVPGGCSFLPFLGASNGDAYALAWTTGDDVVGVLGLLVGENVEIEYPEVEDLLDVLVRAFDVGAFFVNSDGVLDMDAERFDELTVSEDHE